MTRFGGPDSLRSGMRDAESTSGPSLRSGMRTITSMAVGWAVQPPKTLASRVRELLSESYEHLLEADEAHLVAMVAHEMVENVVKYSSDGKSTFEAEIGDCDGLGIVRLRSCNRAASDQRDALLHLGERIRGAADPVALYDQLIAESADRSGSGLGLARIRAEAEMEIAVSVEGDRVTIVAERRVTLRGKPA